MLFPQHVFTFMLERHAEVGRETNHLSRALEKERVVCVFSLPHAMEFPSALIDTQF